MVRIHFARSIVGFATVSLIGAIGYFCYGQAPEKSDVNWPRIQGEQDRIDQTFDSLKHFQAELFHIYSEVSDHDLSLEDAITQIEKASQEHYPEYLHRLQAVKKSGGLREGIAENVISFFVGRLDRSGDNTHVEQVLARLRSEQAVLFSDHSHAVAADH
jgi:hypothetical protein